IARELTHVDSLLREGLIDELPADWCRRLKLKVRPANRSKAIVVKRDILGPHGERLIELDHIVFDDQLREGAPGGDVWLDLRLVHPVDRESEYRCSISTRFDIADKLVSAAIAGVQRRWSARFGAHFFRRGEAKRYVYSPQAGKVTRAFGARSRYSLARE